MSFTATIIAVLAIAQPSTAASAPANAPAAAPERKVCRVVTVTGSRFDKRVCRTQAEWAAEAEKSGDAVRDIQSQPSINPDSRG